jgi:hypothetical protein
VWSHPTSLTFVSENGADGLEWARRMRPCDPLEDGQLLSTDIDTILRNSGFERISILKIDVEGAEAEIFASNYESWLDRVDNLVIELHGDSCSQPFYRAVGALPFAVSACDELTVCKRILNETAAESVSQGSDAWRLSAI